MTNCFKANKTSCIQVIGCKGIVLLSFMAMVFSHSSCFSEKRKDEQQHALANTDAHMLDEALTSIKVLKRTHNMGMVTGDTLVKAEYPFINTGSEKLIIQEVLPDCMCTGYELTADTILPGDTASIILALATKGKSGPVEVNAIVRTNTDSRLHNLSLKASIIEKPK